MRFGSILTTAVLIAGAGAAYWYLFTTGAQSPKAPTTRAEGRRAAKRDSGPVPVTVEVVKQETVPVYRDGIGNVQALFTVTVRAQVDGRLNSVEFNEGQEVRKGDVLARIDPTIYQAQYDQAVAKKAQDEATLANARIDLQRYRRLAQTNAGPQQQADQQAATVAQLEAQVKSDDAAIDNAKAYLDYTTIKSPLDGRIGLRFVDPGNIVHASDANGLVSITQVKPIAAIFTLPQRDLPAISASLARGEVKVEVLETGGRGVLASGTLQTIDNQIDISTGTIRLKAIFPNPDQKLWPGQFVSARVVVDTLVNAKVVPTTAIRRGPNGTFVFALGEDDKVAVTPVTVDLQDETRAVIGKGIDVGTRVVTVGFPQLSNGKDVRIVNDEQQDKTASDGEAKAGGQGERKRKRDGSGERKRDELGGHERRRRHDSGTSDSPASEKGVTREAAQ